MGFPYKNVIDFEIDINNSSEMELFHRIIYDKNPAHFIINFIDEYGDYEISIRHIGLKGVKLRQEISGEYFEEMFEYDPCCNIRNTTLTDISDDELENLPYEVNYVTVYDDGKNSLVMPELYIGDYLDYYPDVAEECYSDFLRSEVDPIIAEGKHRLVSFSPEYSMFKNGNGRKITLKIKYTIEEL